MSGWTVAWLVWLLYFGALETAAIARSAQAKRAGDPNPTNTLSEHVWMWFGTAKGTPPNTSAYLRRFALVAFLAWLSIHMLGGGQFV